MNAPVCSECGLCRLEGPDPFGNYDLDVRPGCPIHDEAPAQVVPIRPTDFHDKVQDLRAELAPDRFALTVPQAVRHTLDYEAEHSHLHLGRHPFGLPRLIPVAAPNPGDVPVGPRSDLSSRARADGHHLPDLAA